MVRIEDYITQLNGLLKEQFGPRLLYVGLQGSYLRGEATDSSDIDMMVVFDELSVSDLASYRAILQSMEHFDRSCGFICSKRDLEHWNPLEIHHLLHGTRDYYGALRSLIPAYTEQDIRNFVKLSVNNLYHEICHRFIHAENKKDTERLAGSYKGVFFILQNLYFLTHGVHMQTKAELLQALEGKNREVLAKSLELNGGCGCDFDESFELLFTWCQETLKVL